MNLVWCFTLWHNMWRFKLFHDVIYIFLFFQNCFFLLVYSTVHYYRNLTFNIFSIFLSIQSPLNTLISLFFLCKYEQIDMLVFVKKTLTPGYSQSNHQQIEKYIFFKKQIVYVFLFCLYSVQNRNTFNKYNSKVHHKHLLFKRNTKRQVVSQPLTRFSFYTVIWRGYFSFWKSHLSRFGDRT